MMSVRCAAASDQVVVSRTAGVLAAPQALEELPGPTSENAAG